MNKVLINQDSDRVIEMFSKISQDVLKVLKVMFAGCEILEVKY